GWANLEIQTGTVRVASGLVEMVNTFRSQAHGLPIMVRPRSDPRRNYRKSPRYIGSHRQKASPQLADLIKLFRTLTSLTGPHRYVPARGLQDRLRRRPSMSEDANPVA